MLFLLIGHDRSHLTLTVGTWDDINIFNDVR